jgi:uracil-DNA glycosylase
VKAFWSSEQGARLAQFLNVRIRGGAIVYPSEPLRALELTDLDEVHVVILGQDPYHGAGQAHGLAFSVPCGVKPPPSLVNIYKELDRDPGVQGFTVPQTGNLEPWATRGILLLNTTLTVEQGLPGSHAEQGWEALTSQLICELARQPHPIVFMLWGAHAQSKEQIIRECLSKDLSSKLILKSNHPSPLSAFRGKNPFLGNAHFSQASAWLAYRGVDLSWWL